MVEVVAVTPNWRWDRSPLPTDTLAPPESPPLEWAYLGSAIGATQLSMVDAYHEDLVVSDVVGLVMTEAPETVLISSIANILYWRCPPFSVQAVRVLVDALDEAGFSGDIVVVGPHGTHSPASTLRTTGADVVWRGVTEESLAQALARRQLRDSRFAYVGPGTGGHIAVSRASQIPRADLSFFGERLYAPHAWSLTQSERALMGDLHRGLLLEASRGCPWSCAYCAKGPVRDRFERRPIERVAAEITAAKDSGWDYVFFIDETFNIPSVELDELLDVLHASGLRFGFQGRPDLVDAARARRLADAGCVYVEFGVDVAGDQLSREVGRRQHIDRAQRGIEAASDHIPIVRYNRLNMQTIDYRALYPSDRELEWDVPVDPIYPYPGAPLGEAFMQLHGMAEFDWEVGERYSWWLRMEVNLQRTQPHLAQEDIRAAQARFMALTRAEAISVAESMQGIQSFDGLHDLNKAVMGKGGALHIRSTSA